MKKHTLLGTILSAALITAGSVAMAQQSGTGSSGGSGAGGAAGPRGTAPIQEQSPSTPGGSSPGTMTPGASPSSPSAPSSDMSSSSTMAPTEDLVGKNVVNAQGEEIGEISAVLGNQVIVEVGGFLGIGAREVAVDWDKITRSGTGDDMKLQTTLTKNELEAMPEYKN